MLWHLLQSSPRSGAANMAIDSTMLAFAERTGLAVARVYSWQTPTVSFGVHQTVRGVYDPHLIAADGYDVVRRPTGGRALLHHREITYALAAPIEQADSLRTSYTRLTTLVADALRTLGVPVETSPRTSRAIGPGAAPCFDAPAEGELVVADRKLVGSAQLRRDGAVLQHGSILIDDDQPRLRRYILVPTVESPPACTLRSLLPVPPTIPAFTQALAASLAQTFGSMPAPITLRELGSDVFKRELSRFADPAWTWRR